MTEKEFGESLSTLEDKLYQLRKERQELCREFIIQHSKLEAGQIITITYPAGYTETFGIIGTPEVKYNGITERYDIFYEGRQLKKDGSIKKIGHIKKLSNSMLDRSTWSVE